MTGTHDTSPDESTRTTSQDDDLTETIEAIIDERLMQNDPYALETEEDGTVSLGGLLEMGLTRRQAFVAIGLVAMGYTLGNAMVKAITSTAAAQSTIQGSVGTEDIWLSAIYATEIHANDLFSDVHHETQVVATLDVDKIEHDGPYTETTPTANDGNLDVSSSNQFMITQNGSLSISVVNGSHALDGQSIAIYIDGDGSNITWPNEFNFGEDAAPEPNSPEEFEVVAWTRDGGMTWRAATVWRSG